MIYPDRTQSLTFVIIFSMVALLTTTLNANPQGTFVLLISANIMMVRAAML